LFKIYFGDLKKGSIGCPFFIWKNSGKSEFLYKTIKNSSVFEFKICNFPQKKLRIPVFYELKLSKDFRACL